MTAVNLNKPHKLLGQILSAAGLESSTVLGVSVRPDLKIQPEVAHMFALAEWKSLSVNLGGSSNSVIGTVGVKTSKQFTLHGGASAPWATWNDLKTYGLFLGFEYRF